MVGSPHLHVITVIPTPTRFCQDKCPSLQFISQQRFTHHDRIEAPEVPKEDSNVDEHGTITDGYGKKICSALLIYLVSDGSLCE